MMGKSIRQICSYLGQVLYVEQTEFVNFLILSGADPIFLEGGFKYIKVCVWGGGSFSAFYLDFHKFSHEIEISWF